MKEWEKKSVGLGSNANTTILNKETELDVLDFDMLIFLMK
jgi:hypothetical protein